MTRDALRHGSGHGDLPPSLEHEHEGESPPTAFGWQFECQLWAGADSPTALLEIVPFVSGLEQGPVLFSLSTFAGLRMPGGTEFVVGPYLSPNGVGLGVAIGHTFRTGDLNLPVNVGVTRNNNGERYSFTVGWNLRH